MAALEDFAEHLTVLVVHQPTGRRFLVDSVLPGTDVYGKLCIAIVISKVSQREEI